MGNNIFGNNDDKIAKKTENIQNFNVVSSSSKNNTIKSSNNSLLSKKRESSKENNNSQISAKRYKEKKISESKKISMDFRDMSSSQIGQEKDQLIKEIEMKQKRLKDLEKYENELNQKIKNTLIISKYKYEGNNKDKKLILKSVREIMTNFYRENEKSINPIIKNMDQNEFDNKIKAIEQFNVETFLNTQCIDNKSSNKGLNIINLDENEDLNPKKRMIVNQKI